MLEVNQTETTVTTTEKVFEVTMGHTEKELLREILKEKVNSLKESILSNIRYSNIERAKENMEALVQVEALHSKFQWLY